MLRDEFKQDNSSKRVIEIPCRCGKGHFRIELITGDDCSTDTPCRYKLSIECVTCDLVYYLDKQENDIVVLEKQGVFKNEVLIEEAMQRWRSLLDTPEVKKILADFILLLESQRTKVAIHSLLRGAGLTTYSLATFRKHWSDPESFIKWRLHSFELPKVMELVGNNSPDVLKETQVIEQLWEDAKSFLPDTGGVIYTISTEQPSDNFEIVSNGEIMPEDKLPEPAREALKKCGEEIQMVPASTIPSVSPEVSASGSSSSKCPTCNGPMKRQVGRFGHFLSCMNYPQCYGTRSIRHRSE